MNEQTSVRLMHTQTFARIDNNLQSTIYFIKNFKTKILKTNFFVLPDLKHPEYEISVWQ